jgi:hypothetical protein
MSEDLPAINLVVLTPQVFYGGSTLPVRIKTIVQSH